MRHFLQKMAGSYGQSGTLEAEAIDIAVEPVVYDNSFYDHQVEGSLSSARIILTQSSLNTSNPRALSMLVADEAHGSSRPLSMELASFLV